MLTEIFYRLGENILEFLGTKEVNTKKIEVIVGPSKAKRKSKLIRIELLRFGRSQEHKNFLGNAPGDKSFYAFTFFIMINRGNYEDCLQLTELICDYLDKHPFMQIKINEKEFEVAASSLELTIEQLNQFWMAQNQPHQPVLFYQARISDI